MASSKTKRTTPSPVPTRKEFHKEFAGIISEADFCTEHCNPYRIAHQESADRFNSRCKKTQLKRKKSKGEQYSYVF